MTPTTAPSVRDLGVYVHWPYCARICPYCDFNVRKNRPVDAERWAAALARDLETQAARAPGRRLVSVYVGGGTPSLAPAPVIAAVIDACRALWPSADDLEVTLEANPTDAEAARFAAFRDAGVNRLSLGVQALNDADLKFLGRNHSAAEARAAVAAAIDAFARVSVDMIYALPHQKTDDWADALDEALSLGATHLSLYQLTIEPETAFARAVARRAWSPPDADAAADLFDLTQTMTAAAGLQAYEISNHAAPGAQARHNRLYWRGDDYIGVGPGAHGRLGGAEARAAFRAERDPAAWLARVEATGDGVEEASVLTAEEAFTERLAMGLRAVEGVRLTPAESARLSPRLETLAEDGLLVLDENRLAATDRGRAVLDALLCELLRD